MVIQRSWKILSDTGSTSASSTEANRSPSVLNSSSDDSNCSNQTTHSMVTSMASPPPARIEPSATVPPPSAEPVVSSVKLQKFVTTMHMAETMLQRLKQRLGCPVACGGTAAEPAMRSMELLRISVQSAFDREIDGIVKQYMEKYFKPALNNVKENLGQNAVSEDMLQKMSCALLENAKGQYNAFRMKPQGNYSTTHAMPADHAAVRVALKRPASKAAHTSDITKKAYSGTSAMQAHGLQGGTAKSSLSQQSNQTSTAHSKTPATGTSPRRQIFWNTAHICTTTKFVLDVQANQAFGFGTDGKERLASKHPELIRYLPDNEDREWLIGQNIISNQNRNSRFLFLIYDEVCKLQLTHENYRTKPNIDLSMMHTFTVPEFMIQKMKIFFVDLNIKSRGLITNSFSMSAVQSNSHLRNALLQGVQSKSTNAATTASSTVSASGAASASASASATTTATATSSGAVNTTNSAVVAAESTTNAGNTAMASSAAASADNPSTMGAGTVGTSQYKPKGSTLSSSHATLTALLNNSNSSCNSVRTTEKGVAIKLRK